MNKNFIQLLLFFFIFCFLSKNAHTQNAVRVGKHVVENKDLDTRFFLNGDEIPYFNSLEEAKEFSLKGKPACVKVGDHTLYNWYAINDPRKIGREGWHVPSYPEMDDFQFYCRQNINSIIENEKLSILPGEPSGYDNDSREPFYNWWVGGQDIQFQYVQILKSTSKIGPIKFETVNKSDFYPVRLFSSQPNNLLVSSYFTRKKELEVFDESSNYKITISIESCENENEENLCNGKSTIEIFSLNDSTFHKIITTDELAFYINNHDELVSDLGVVFEDFNLDGLIDFGFGFGNKFEQPELAVFLSKANSKYLIKDKAFMELFQNSEDFSFNLKNRIYEGFSLSADFHSHVKYYLAPKDSLEEFRNYKLPIELDFLKINYPNVFLIEYFSMNGNIIKKFKWNNDFNMFTKHELNDIEYNEYTKQHDYSFQFENDKQIHSVTKIDSSQFYSLYKNIIQNPFVYDSEYNEKTKIKEFSSTISRKGKKLKIKLGEKEILLEDNEDDQGNFYLFRGETENKKYYIITYGGEYCGSNEILINKDNGRIDTIPRYPRFTPNGEFVVTGNFEIDETGQYGFLELYKMDNGGLIKINTIPIGELEYSFAPYDLFWTDNNSIAIKQIKNDQSGDYYFEYAIIKFDLTNY